jgi:hypothetical protein
MSSWSLVLLGVGGLFLLGLVLNLFAVTSSKMKKESVLGRAQLVLSGTPTPERLQSLMDSARACSAYEEVARLLRASNHPVVQQYVRERLSHESEEKS